MGSCCSCLKDSSDEASVSPIADNEREAVTLLLGYLEDKDQLDFYSGGPLKALTTLVYSDNLNLQRSPLWHSQKLLKNTSVRSLERYWNPS